MDLSNLKGEIGSKLVQKCAKEEGLKQDLKVTVLSLYEFYILLKGLIAGRSTDVFSYN